MSAMAVSDSKMFGGETAVCVDGSRYGGGVGLHPGLESKVAKAVYARSNFNLFMQLVGPLCQVTKSSQPLFLFFPGPKGLDRVAEFTWSPVSPSLVLFLHNMLLCLGPSPHPWVEQNLEAAPVIQLPRIAAWSWFIRAAALVRSSEVKGRLRPPSPLPPPPPLLPLLPPTPPPPGATYSASRVYNLESIVIYCVVAAAARYYCTTLLPAFAADRAVK